ncbi:MAG: transposase, partial [Actinobacteria bacterium]|nr:transposase [Actinomycetota bacterium]
MIVKSLGMLSLGHVSLDGSKFYANTSKHKAASYKKLKENEAKLTKEIDDLLKKAEICDDAEDKIYHNGKGYSIPEDLKIKEKRLAKIKKVKKALENRERKADPTEDIKDSSQISYADSEAKIMKHKGGFDYCYNGQISVDSNSQIIVGQHLTQNENDKKEVEKALCEIEDNTGKVPDKMSLDNGYMSSGNISALAGAKVDAYIAAGKGEKDSLPDKIGKLNFSHDSSKDIFICPAYVVLKLKSIGENRVYKAEEMVCGGCSFQKMCSVKRNDIATIYTDDKGIILATIKEK